MSRSPLFDSLRQALRSAALAAREQPGAPPIDELIDMARTRRGFLRDSALVSAGLVISTGCSRPAPPTNTTAGASSASRGGPRIAIVGGGMAGLNTAYKLQKAGLNATIYEGAERTGGRIFTATGLLGARLTTELGGEFIDTGHLEMLALMDEFKLERLDAKDVGTLKEETYFINGRHYTLAEAARGFVPLARQIQADYDSMGEVVNYQTEGGGSRFDKMPMSQYFDAIDATGWIRELLECAYVTEYGLDASEQSALNFIFQIATGDLTDAKSVVLLGDSDERYKIRGGNQRVVDELARRLEPQIQRRRKLEAIRSKGNGYTVTFQTGNGSADQDADIVVLAMPFTMLRDVKIDVELTPIKRKAIAELGYGAIAKVVVGFKSHPWQKLGYSGAIYSDETFQLAWDNSFNQAPPEGGLTLFGGGKLALAAGEGSAEEAAGRLLKGIERAFPGTTAERNGKVSRMHWPTFAWTKGAYSCYKPGQWTTIAGAEGLPVGNLFFAGEHCSYDFQGYMNGAAQSGADTAKAVMATVNGSALRTRRQALLTP